MRMIPAGTDRQTELDVEALSPPFHADSSVEIQMNSNELK
jgi:hypothetical protein